MRTTLTIDDDILAAARRLAERDRKTVGEVVSTLARQGLTRTRTARSPQAERNGISLLPERRRAPAITPELVSRLRDELP